MHLLTSLPAVAAALALTSTVSAIHSHQSSHKSLVTEILERRSLRPRSEHVHNHLRSHQFPREYTPVEPFTGFEVSPSYARSDSKLNKRTTCAFPTDAGLVAVNPSGANGGWAMSPDEPCTSGKYCPYACPPGELMAQWDPSATSYAYPQSMNGGLKCGDDGKVTKPFPNKPYCYPGTGSIAAVNKCSGGVAFCQTVLPGNEAMLIATSVDSSATLAVPGMEYWASTAAHYYINPPGVSTSEGCIWGDGSKPIGNWSPYVAGANTIGNGDTFVKIAWNPIYTGESVFANELPKFGIRVTCEGGGCNGLPCSIDPSTVSVNGVTSGNSATGAGGGNFCVVTVSKGSQAKIETFDVGGSTSPKEEEVEEEEEPEVEMPEVEEPEVEEPKEEPTPTPTPTPTSTPTPTPTPETSTIIEETSTIEPTTQEETSTTAPPTRSITQLDSSTTMTTSSKKTYMSVAPIVMLEVNSTLTDSADTFDESEDMNEENSLTSYKKTGSSTSDSSSSKKNETEEVEEAKPAQTSTAAAATESKEGGSSTLQFSIALAGIFAAFSLLM